MDFDEQKMLIQEIDELIELEKYDVAKKKLENLYGRLDEVLRLSKLRKIARKEGNVEEEKRLIHIILELDPDNVKAMTSAKRIARKEGNIEEEKIFIERLLKLEPYNLRNIIRRKVIARGEQDLETEKEMLDMELTIDSSNLKSILRRQLIARQEGDIKREKELLDMELKLKPNNQKAIFRRRLIAKQEEDLKNEKKLLDMLLQANPNKVKLLSSRMRIARQEGDIKTEKLLLERLIEQEPRNEIAIKRRITIARIESDEKNKEKYEKMLKKRPSDLSIEKMMLQEDEKKNGGCLKLSYVDSIRTLIYGNENIMETSEKINELLENVDETTREILIAELYFTSNMPLRAERSLKTYKKKLEEDKDIHKDDVKLIGSALELIKSKKTRKYNWDNLWQKKEELEQEDER